MNLRCKMGWHSWWFDRVAYDVNDRYRKKTERVDGDEVLWAYAIHCKMCGAKRTVLHTEKSSIAVREKWGWGIPGLVSGPDEICETYVLGRHAPTELGLCGHPQRSHGVWDERGDHYIYGACRDCQCKEFS